MHHIAALDHLISLTLNLVIIVFGLIWVLVVETHLDWHWVLHADTNWRSCYFLVCNVPFLFCTQSLWQSWDVFPWLNMAELLSILEALFNSKLVCLFNLLCKFCMGEQQFLVQVLLISAIMEENFAVCLKWRLNLTSKWFLSGKLFACSLLLTWVWPCRRNPLWPFVHLIVPCQVTGVFL